MSADADRIDCTDRTELSASTGDLPTDAFRKYGHEMIDWIAEYLEDPTQYPVLSQSHLGDTIAALPRSAPVMGEVMTTQALGLPTQWFGMINDRASTSTTLALVAARGRKSWNQGERHYRAL